METILLAHSEGIFHKFSAYFFRKESELSVQMVVMTDLFLSFWTVIVGDTISILLN